MPDKKELLILFFILILAFFFRFWKLNSIPPGLYPDVAMYANDALETLKTGNFKVFYPHNFGREGLFIWLLAFSFSIFGVSIWSIKIVAAIIGILTVFGLYLLTKELFSLNSQIVEQSNSQIAIALLSSFFLATSFWHVNFSRIGFRAILLPFILVSAFYFLFRGSREKKVLNFIISGILFGLGFYTYVSYRFIVLLLPLVLICWFLIYRKQGFQRRYLSFIFYFLFFIFFTALPIGIYFLKNPGDFIGRAAPISVFRAENPIKEFGKSLILHLGMFNFYGDPNWRHNFSGSPMLPWPVGILFLIGIILSFKEIFKKSNYQSENRQSLFTFYFLLFTFFIMLLPGILTFEGIPHSLRVIGVIPVVYIFVALGFWWIYQKLRQNTKNKKLLLAGCILFLVAVSFSEFNKYFVQWGKNKEVEEAFTKRYADIGYYLNALPENVQKYVIVNELGVPFYGISIPAQTPMFIEIVEFGQLRSIYLPAENLNQIKINQKVTVIVPLYNGKLLDELRKRFPQGQVKQEKEFWVYMIK